MSECNHDCSSCKSKCSSADSAENPFYAAPNPLSSVKHVIGVVSGKGGVGKTTTASAEKARSRNWTGIFVKAAIPPSALPWL